MLKIALAQLISASNTGSKFHFHLAGKLKEIDAIYKIISQINTLKY